MKLIASDATQARILHAAFTNRERFTLTGSGLRAQYVAHTFNREPLAFGGYGESVELEQVSAAESIATYWRGPEDGLPPVGLDVEVLWSSICRTYVTGKVLAHDEDRAVFRFTTGERKGEYQADKPHSQHGVGLPNFRPIRTPEQIAAEERVKTIDEMAAIYKSNYEGHVKDGCQALYDAGYRKFEIGDEQP